jgi:hypothetical protein
MHPLTSHIIGNVAHSSSEKSKLNQVSLLPGPAWMVMNVAMTEKTQSQTVFEVI